MEESNRVKVQRIKPKKIDSEELFAQVCYHYPQYDLDTAAQLSYRRIVLLLKTARRQQAIHYYNLIQIVAAPHTKKGKGVSKLSEHFKKMSESK